MKKLSLLILPLVLVVAACSSRPPDPSQFKGTMMPAAIPAPQFSLTNAEGQEVALHDYLGKIVLLYFGYTFCPDICPTSLADLKRVQNTLDENGEQIQVIMITVDPKRDTPEKIAEYVEYFHPTFIGLSGELEQIEAVTEDYGVFFEIHDGTEATGYLVDHTARIFVVDQEGNYQLSFGYGTPVDDMVHDLRLLLANK